MAAEKPGNAIYCDNLPRDEYNKIAKNCDVGIVTLDPRYTIPNYPSKVLSYLEYALPVLAATDVNTDFRQLVENEAKCGLWCPSTDKNAFLRQWKNLPKISNYAKHTESTAENISKTTSTHCSGQNGYANYLPDSSQCFDIAYMAVLQ